MIFNFRNKNSRYLIKRKPSVLLVLVIIIVFLIIFIGVSKITSSTRVKSFFDKVLGREDKKVEIVYKEEKTVKMLEGWTNLDLNNHLENLGFNYWPEGDFFKAVGKKHVYNLNQKQDIYPDWQLEFDFLASKDSNLSLEGYLFPDTYRVFASTTAESVVRRLLQNFDDKLSPEMRREIERQGKTIHEIVTMASIIEKEAPIFKQKDIRDAKIISGIFWNRLRIGMALQSDATLSYIFGDNKPAHEGAELEVDSPYNSYKYPGLPPGPICNPGLVAIEAAIYPEKTDYFYFLTPLEGGAVYYGKTYAEHLYNKNRYLK